MSFELPLKATLGDRPVMIVAAEEYARLTSAEPSGPLDRDRQETDEPEFIVGQLLRRKRRKSPFLQDRDVALFILLAGSGDKQLSTIRAECIERFGKERSPSLSALSRLLLATSEVRSRLAREHLLQRSQGRRYSLFRPLPKGAKEGISGELFRCRNDCLTLQK